MNPTPFKKVLQSLHWHFRDTHFLIAFLKLVRDSKDFSSTGAWFHHGSVIRTGITCKKIAP